MEKHMVCHDGPSTSKAIKQADAPKEGVKRKRGDDDGFGQFFLKTRMSPKMMLTFINSNLSAKQVADINEIGFGGLLNLKAAMVPGALAYWLVSTFNVSSCSYMKGKLQILDEDIHLSLGIPMGPTAVTIASKTDKSDVFTEIKSTWLQQFGRQDLTKVNVKDILNLIISQREGGEAFQRNFIVFIVSAFLMGVKGTCASLRVLKCLRDISAVKSFNWCQFARKQFIQGVKSWKKSGPVVFGGPIMVFVYIYLDRVSFSYFSVTRVFPTLASWTEDLIQSRLDDEMKDGFGKGGVLPPIVKSSVQHVTFSVPSQSNMSEPKATASVEDSKHRSISSVKKLAEDANNLALAYQTFSNSLAAATMDWPECKIVQQICQISSALSECCYSSQPTSDENNKVEEKDAKVEEKGEKVEKKGDKGKEKDDKVEEKGDKVEKQGEKAESEEQGDKVDPVTEFRKLKFETEEQLLAALYKLETALGKRPATDTSNVMHKRTQVKASDPIFVHSKAKSASPIPLDTESQDIEPNFQEKTKPSTTFRRLPRFQAPSPPNFTPPSFPFAADFTPPSFRLLSSESQSPEQQLKNFCDEALNLGARVEVVEPLVVEPISSLACKEPLVMPTMIKRKRVETQLFRSPFLQRSILVAGNLNKCEKDTLEHVFSDGCDDSEILFETDNHKLSRADFKTLVTGDTVPKMLIHVWCCLLNKSETRRAPSSPYRLYVPQVDDEVTTTHTAGIDNNFTGANLIFVPIISARPFVFCFNFKAKKLEVLHVMRPKSVTYAAMIQSTKQFVINFFVRNKIPLGDRVQDIDSLVTEEYIPKSNLGDGVDFGIYLMRILEKYKGTRKSFPLGLHNHNQVKVFGARVCSEIYYFAGNKVLSKAASSCLDMRFQEFQNTRHTQRQLTDTELIGRVMNTATDPDLNDILVDTEWMQVCRKGMQSLQNRHWVMDLVLDMYGVMCTYNRSDILYLPSTVQYAKPERRVNKGNIVWCPHLKMHYRPQNAATIDKVFFTIGKNGNHWLACVSDLKKEENCILDSCKPKLKPGKALDNYNAYVDDIVFHVANQFDRRNGYNRLQSISLFTSVNVDVPQQSNNCDCGLFVMKFLEATIRDTNLWKDNDFFTDMIAYRRQIMLKLLKWEKNTSKVLFQEDG